MHHWIQSYRAVSVTQLKMFLAKAQKSKWKLPAFAPLAPLREISSFVRWFAYCIEDVDFAFCERAPVEVDDQRVESD